MPYFERKDPEKYTPSFAPVSEDESWNEDDLDDGFDSLMEDPDETEDDMGDEPDPEELRLARRRKYRIAAGIGDLAAVLIGTGVILALVAFLINILQFVSSDFSRTFSLWQTRF